MTKTLASGPGGVNGPPEPDPGCETAMSAHRLCGDGRPWILFAAGCAQGLDRGPRLVVELGRHLDVDGDQQVAASASLGCRALAARPERATARRAGGNSDADRRAVERRHRDGGAERGLVERHRHRDGEMVALAPEQRVLGDVHDQVEVAVRRTVTLAALALEPDALAVLDAGRH